MNTGCINEEPAGSPRQYRIDGGNAELAAVVYLPPGEAVLAGAMCAAPEGDGFDVTFADLAVVGSPA
jgi:regulation of enolase protein 1 (concanavalin A-like superfamily)